MSFSFSKIDQLLGLKRGSASYYHKRGIFHASRVGRGFRVEDDDLPTVAEAISEFINPPPIQDGDQLLTPTQAAEILDLKVSTVYNNIKRGRLVTARKPQSNRIWVTVSSVQHYLDTRVPPEVALHLPRVQRRRPVLGEQVV